MLHRLIHQLLHAREFLGGRRAVHGAHDVPAHLRRANICAKIDAGALLLQPPEVPVKIAPICGQVIMLKEVTAISQGRIVLWSNGYAFAGYPGSDSLSQFADSLLVDQQIPLGLLQHVNEPGRYHQSFGVNQTFGRGVGRRPAQKADAVGCNADVGIDPRVPGAIHHAAVTDEKCRTAARRPPQRTAARRVAPGTFSWLLHNLEIQFETIPRIAGDSTRAFP